MTTPPGNDATSREFSVSREDCAPANVSCFELAAGSVPGREHVRLKRGSQDGFCCHHEPALMVVVVCDGCGSGSHSEVGAKLGARLLVNGLRQRLASGATPGRELIAAAVREDLLAHVDFISRALGGDRRDVISDYFLFTIVGAIITPALTLTFSIGDGLVAVNGEVRALGPFAHNQPPYPAYELVCPGFVDSYLDVHVVEQTARVHSVLIASDGAHDLIAAAAKPMPGRTVPIGDLSQFWTDDPLFRNRDALRRRLAMVNRDAPDQRGYLPDDTTVIAVRRRSGA